MIKLFGPNGQEIRTDSAPDTNNYGRATNNKWWGYKKYSYDSFDEHYCKWGLNWYNRISTDPQVAAALDIFYSAVISNWNSASGSIPSEQEWQELKQEIDHLPLTFQNQIIAHAFNISAPQVIPPRNPTPIELEATDFARYVIDSCLGRNQATESDVIGRNFGRVLWQTMTAMEDKKSVQEIDWQLAESGPWAGKWIINDIWHRYPEYFDIDEDGRLWLGDDMMPSNKFIVFLNSPKYEIYEGRSIYQSLGYTFDFKRNAEAMNAIYEERFGMPTAVSWKDTSSDMSHDDLLDIMSKLQRGANISLNKEAGEKVEDIDFLESQRRDSSTYQETISRNDKYSSKVILGSALALEEGDNGSYSLAKATAAPNFRRKVGLWLKQLNWIHNTTTLSWLTWFNFPIGTRPPSFDLKLPVSVEDFQGLAVQEGFVDPVNGGN